MRYFLSILLTLLAANQISGADEASRPYRLDFDLEVKATAPLNSSYCPTTASEIVPAGYTDLCQPDPTARICSTITERDLEKDSRTFEDFEKSVFKAQMDLMASAEKELPESIRRPKELVDARYIRLYRTTFGSHTKDPFKEKSFIQKYSAEPDVKAYVEAAGKIYEFKYKPQLAIHLQEDRVRAAIKRLVIIYEKTLRRSYLLSSDDIDTMMPRIKDCMENIKLVGEQDSYYSGADFGARVEQILPFSSRAKAFKSAFDEPFVATKRVNVVADDLNKCHLEINAVSWQHCISDDIFCAQTIFHELGHPSDTCSMLSLANNARKKAEPLSGQAREVFEKQRAAALGLAGALWESSACLDQLSSPKYAIVDACGAGKKREPIEDSLLDRCPTAWSEFKGDNRIHRVQPDQWAEAEADFWGASALAVWLEERFKTQEERKRAMFVAQKVACTNFARRGGKEGKENLESALHNKIQRVDKNSFTKRTACSERPDPGQWEKAIQADGKVELDQASHQGWAVRIDRHYLRNADMRQILGCPLGAEVPFACSPLGYSKSVLVQ